MIKTYTREDLQSLEYRVDGAIGQAVGPHCPAHVRTALVLAVLKQYLENMGAEIPVGLLPLQDIVSKTHAVYVRLCTEGLDKVS